MIDNTSIESLKNIIDIVDVIGNSVELKKNGSNYKACCPFHDEKTPSFVVSPAKQIAHCFGCGWGGDTIKFVMENEKLSYPEAIEKLAQMYNFSLVYTNDGGVKEPESKLLEALLSWYKTLLEKNVTALKYLKERGIYESSIEKFELSYAPASQMSVEFMQANLFNMKEAIDLGVLGSDNGRSYARFIERILFPIRNNSGKLVGFGGRTITNHPAKYVNSPQTKLFNKSKLLYAYHLAKDAVYKSKEVIVCEGYLDVVMLHQAGFNNAVATLGTALTSEHLPLLRKGEPRIILSYDGDSAGIAAALRAAKMLSAANFDGGVVIFKGGQDPADMVQSARLEELKHLFKHPKGFIEFVLEQSIAAYDIKVPRQKEAALNEATNFLKSLSPILQEEYKGYLAAILNINSALVKVGTAKSSFPSKQVYQYQNRFSGKKQVEPMPVVVEQRGVSPQDMGELGIIKTLANEPERMDYILEYLDTEVFIHHGFEFDLLKQEQSEHPAILKVVLNDEIKSFTVQELEEEIKIKLIDHYNRLMKQVVKLNMISLEQKSFKIRQIREKIQNLKKGKLVVYEGSSII